MPVTSDDPTVLLPKIPHQPNPTEPTPPTDEPDLWEVPPPAEPLDAPWLRTVACVVPAVLCAALGVAGAWSPGLSADELGSWSVAIAPDHALPSALRPVDAATHPLYYLLLRVWSEVVGGSDLVLRLPSVLAMAGSACLVAALGVRLAGLRVGLAAGLLFAVLPTASRHAQDVGPAALATLLALAATALLLRLLDRAGALTWCAYAAGVALLGLASTMAVLVVVAHVVVVVALRPGVRVAAAWAAAAVAGVGAAAPLYYLGYHEPQLSLTALAPLSLPAVFAAPANLFGGPVIAGAVLALAFVGASVRRPVLVATAWAVVPVAALAAASLVTPLWSPRSLLLTLPGWTLLAALALRQFSLVRGVCAVAAVGLLGLPAQLDIRRADGHGQVPADVGVVLEAFAEPGDAIVYGAGGAGNTGIAQAAVRRYAGPEHRPVEAALGAGAGATAPRIWVLSAGAPADPLADLSGAEQGVLRAGYSAGPIWRLRGYAMVLYVRQETA